MQGALGTYFIGLGDRGWGDGGGGGGRGTGGGAVGRWGG